MGRRKSKYGNQPVTVDNIRFDSQREAGRYAELKLLLAAGQISNLELQPRFPLTAGGKPITYRNGRQAAYVADFAYDENGQRVVEDAKGCRTRLFRLKAAILRAERGLEIREV